MEKPSFEGFFVPGTAPTVLDLQDSLRIESVTGFIGRRTVPQVASCKEQFTVSKDFCKVNFE